ncbi:MAG TPA: hypothetical protein VGE96_02550, partial [Steroidobacteraceae bacterium]
MATRKNTRARRKSAAEAKNPRSRNRSSSSIKTEEILNRLSCVIAVLATAVDALAHGSDPGKMSASDAGERASTVEHGLKILREVNDELDVA